MRANRSVIGRTALQIGSVLLLGIVVLFGACTGEQGPPAWETANPVQPLPTPPLGIASTFDELEDPPTPERVRLGRWLFYDTRLSADDSISCATCHIPEFAFSEPDPVSTGIDGQKGGRKAPSFVNLAWTIFPHFFWDGRAASLEEQAKGPIINPIEMGMEDHEVMIAKLSRIDGYKPYFKEVFGDEEITVDRVAKAIADYERTKCNQCHFGQNFTDNRFHNLGVGWDPATQEFADIGRFEISGAEEDKGAFKTPGLREVSKHGPFMHDGSMATLRETVVHYDIGGIENPWLSPKIEKLDLTDEEIDAVVAFMEALEGEGYMDVAPTAFPK
jgi:cytochrome c peroxidase